jgi:signal transduction histidine kinase
MRERVKVHGGELRAGARDEGGFEVHATLPLP